ncbi:MAG: hypothetical protein AB1489_07270 [Acidobacteriota bacterium]
MPRRFSAPPTCQRILCVAGLALVTAGCTDRIESTLPPAAVTPSSRPPGEVPTHLKTLFSTHCAVCHDVREQSGKNLYLAGNRSPKNWIVFLKKHPPATKEGEIRVVLAESEYAALGEWLARITKDNNLARPPERTTE